MDDLQQRLILRMVAAKSGVSPETVLEEMKAAIRQGMENPDPAAWAFWRSIPCQGEAPTPGELVAWLASRVREAN